MTEKGCKQSTQGILLVITINWRYHKTESKGSFSDSLGSYWPSADSNWSLCKTQHLAMLAFPFCFSTKYNYSAWRTHIDGLAVQAWLKKEIWLCPINLLISDGAPVRRPPSNPFLQLCIAKFMHLFVLTEEIAKSHIYVFLITREDPIIGKSCNDKFVTYLAITTPKRTSSAWSYLNALKRVNSFPKTGWSFCCP